jgi:hypothetical protein
MADDLQVERASRLNSPRHVKAVDLRVAMLGPQQDEMTSERARVVHRDQVKGHPQPTDLNHSASLHRFSKDGRTVDRSGRVYQTRSREKDQMLEPRSPRTTAYDVAASKNPAVGAAASFAYRSS